MAKLMLCDAHDSLTDLIGKLSGDTGSEWLEVLKLFLNQKSPWLERVEWPIKVRLGQYTSVDEVYKALSKVGIYFSSIDTFYDVMFPDGAREVEIVKVSDCELGLTEEYEYAELIEAVWKSDRYELCPPECVPLARLAYRIGDCILVALKPVTDSIRDTEAFKISAGGGDHNVYTIRVCEIPYHGFTPGRSWLLVRREPLSTLG
ncbi:MAG: hypothetical protein V1738_06905 [Patescibacteria group bacterium]